VIGPRPGDEQADGMEIVETLAAALRTTGTKKQLRQAA
jgi:hypothetical protein